MKAIVIKSLIFLFFCSINSKLYACVNLSGIYRRVDSYSDLYVEQIKCDKVIMNSLTYILDGKDHKIWEFENSIDHGISLIDDSKMVVNLVSQYGGKDMSTTTEQYSIDSNGNLKAEYGDIISPDGSRAHTSFSIIYLRK